MKRIINTILIRQDQNNSKQQKKWCSAIFPCCYCSWIILYDKSQAMSHLCHFYRSYL